MRSIEENLEELRNFFKEMRSKKNCEKLRKIYIRTCLKEVKNNKNVEQTDKSYKIFNCQQKRAHNN